MMGSQEPQKEMFSYQIDLDQRVRPENPLRRIREAIDFGFVRTEVAALYGANGNESVCTSSSAYQQWNGVVSAKYQRLFRVNVSNCCTKNF